MYGFKYYYVVEFKYSYIVKYRRFENDNKPQWICKCFEKDTAEMIADSLNKVE